MHPTPTAPAADAGNRHGRHRSRASATHRTARILGRGAIGLISALVVMATGLAYWEAHGLLGGITISRALDGGDRSSGGAMNILLIGLDSRKDQEGNELPDEMLDKLHAGDSESGGYNTNTLILIHIGADDRVTAFSIPARRLCRGQRHHRLRPHQDQRGLRADQGADRAEARRRRHLRPRRVGARRTRGRPQGDPAGRAHLTGQPIDYFAEVNLAGFYDLAQSLGGVEVCLNHAVHDDFSGADFPAGRQRLDAAQALAFVRQRHGLENGDLDRTHRQQAFLLSVMHELQSSGSFTDLDKFKSLMAVARRDIVLSEGWGEDQFRRMAALAGGDVEFRTLPVLRYENLNGQDVNIVDPAKIRAEIANAIGAGTTTVTTAAVPRPLSPPNPQTVIEMVNASSTSGLAAQAARVLSKQGYTIEQVRDREPSEPVDTVISYGPGARTDAESVATLLGIDNAPQASIALAADNIRVILGEGFDVPPAEPDPETIAETTTTQGWYGVSTTPTPDQGAPIDGGGIPCVN